jgi:hypothetical protein
MCPNVSIGKIRVHWVRQQLPFYEGDKCAFHDLFAQLDKNVTEKSHRSVTPRDAVVRKRRHGCAFDESAQRVQESTVHGSLQYIFRTTYALQDPGFMLIAEEISGLDQSLMPHMVYEKAGRASDGEELEHEGRPLT